MKKKPLIALAAAVPTIVIGIAACGDQSQFDDANVGAIDDTPQFVMTNLDGFPNIAARCFGGHLILTTTRDYGDAVNINWDDPMCADGDVTEWIANNFGDDLTVGDDLPLPGSEDE
jgi:hypothetical protein